jgi:hypothetical protein
MSGYVWRPSHPWKCVTDENGHYELRYPPTGKSYELMVWHEMLETPEKMLRLGEVHLKPNESAQMDAALPKR